MPLDAENGADLGLPAKGWIAFMMLAHMWNIYRTAVIIEDLVSHSDPRWQDGLWWALPTAIAISVLTILALALILFFRRKLGFYAAALFALVAVGVNLAAGVPAGTAIAGLIGFAILGALLARRWDALH